MSFNISEFTSHINEYGVAKKSHFDVMITPPRQTFGNIDTGPTLTRALSLRCENASFPGRTLTTQEHRVYGPQKKIAYGVMYEDTAMTFLCSKNMREKVFFEQWIENIAGIRHGNSNYNSYSMSYYDEYTTDIWIRQFSEDNKETYAVTLRNAYPINVSTMELNRDGEELHKVTIDFTYQYWERSNKWFDEAMEVATPFSLGIFGGIIGAVGGVIAGQLPVGAQRAIGTATGIPNILSQAGNIL